jgi:hypothetical protein
MACVVVLNHSPASSHHQHTPEALPLAPPWSLLLLLLLVA